MPTLGKPSFGLIKLLGITSGGSSFFPDYSLIYCQSVATLKLS